MLPLVQGDLGLDRIVSVGRTLLRNRNRLISTHDHIALQLFTALHGTKNPPERITKIST
jgi:hypothetical protein